MQSTQSTSGDRDSNAIRASVFDVCLQLGALDDNSLVAEWMFNDPSTDGDRAFRRRNRTTRFQEVVSAGWEATEANVPNERRRRYVLPFSIKAPAFAARFRTRRRPPSVVGQPPNHAPEKHSGVEVGPSRVSLSRRSFFRRSIHKPVAPRPNPTQSAGAVCDDTGRISTNPRSFFQRKMRGETAPLNPQAGPPTNSETIGPAPAPAAVPSAMSTDAEPTIPLQSLHELPEDDGDEEWEVIEAHPEPPPFPLHNKGINPPSLDKERHSTAATIDTDVDAEIDIRGATHHNLAFAFPRLMFRRASGWGTPSPQKRRSGKASPKTRTPSPTPTPTPSPGRSPRKPLSILTKHHRGPSSSLPASPFVLLTSNTNSLMPQPTSRIVFSEDVAVRPKSLSDAERRSMGYHNQFFVGKATGADLVKKGERTRSVSVLRKTRRSAAPVVGTTLRREAVPFPVMKTE